MGSKSNTNLRYSTFSESDWICTNGLLLRRQLLYLAELQTPDRLRGQEIHNLIILPLSLRTGLLQAPKGPVYYFGIIVPERDTCDCNQISLTLSSPGAIHLGDRRLNQVKSVTECVDLVSRHELNLHNPIELV